MKWRRSNPAPTSSSTTSLITRVFHLSWLFNLKQKSGIPEINAVKRSGELGFKSPDSSLLFGRFHDTGDFVGGDDYWRLSFSEERIGGSSIHNGGLKLNPVTYDYDKEFQIPVSSFKNFGLREMEGPTRKAKGNRFNDMVLTDMKRMKEEKKQGRFSVDFRSKKGCQEYEMNGNNSRKTRYGSNFLRKKQAGKEEKSSKLMERRDVYEFEPEINVHIKDDNHFGKNSFSFPKLDQISVKRRHGGHESLNDKMGTSETPKDKRIKERKIKTEFEKSSSYINRDFRGKIKTRTTAYSPRTGGKIRAIQYMKKARMKLKMKTDGQILEDRTVFDHFAVVKDSFNPQQDFKNSIIEMLTQKEIKRCEDLEELLACYLKLNCDEFHETIIKVFRQVWFELNGLDYKKKKKS